MFNSNSEQLAEVGYSQAIKLAKSHYENFPVVSFLIPGNFKNDIAIIYWFARTADDFADEGNFSHYRFRLEYRFTGEQLPKGPSWAYRNSGIMLHCHK